MGVEPRFELVWRQQLGGGGGVLAAAVPAADALATLARAAADFDPASGVVLYLRPAGDPLGAVELALAVARATGLPPLPDTAAAVAAIRELLAALEPAAGERPRDPAAQRTILVQVAATAIQALDDLGM
jgi:hypothetical protein